MGGSPRIIRKEADLSNVVVAAGTSVGALVGKTSQGIANARTMLTSDKNFIEKFGQPDSVNLDYSGYAAVSFLRESSELVFVRATSGNEAYSNMCFDASSGELTNGTITAKSSTALVATAGYADGNTPTSIQELNAFAFTGALSGSLFMIGATGPGIYGDDIGIRIITTSVAVSGGYDWVSSYPTGIGAKVFKVEVFTKDATDTDFPSSPEETFFVSRESVKDAIGNSLEMTRVINGNSKYIYIVNNANQASTVYPNPTTVTDVVALDGGADSTGAMTVGCLQSAWGLFNDKEKVSVNILVNPTSDMNIAGTVATIAGTRMDCIAVAQIGASTVLTVDGIKAAATSYTSYPSYIAYYAGYDKVYDSWNDAIIFLPKSIYGACVMAKTDRVANTWDAPAGVNRGVVGDAIGQNVVFNGTEIGQLYDVNINTSKAIQGVGHTIWGQKTAQLKKSALDRINVRRLLIYIENSLENVYLPFLFEGNTDKNRLRIFSISDSFLNGVKGGQGLSSYQVVCDTTNNTPQVIDANELKVDCYLIPVKTVEIINLQAIITRTGVDFKTV